ncbi:MAG: LysR family transcriptional regulator [Paracoccaceae bacterium]
MPNNASYCTAMGKNAQSKLPWADIPILLALMRRNSLAAAAEALGVDRTTVARRLERLEAQLETQLFERISGKLVATDAGRRILSAAERAEQELSHLNPNESEQRFKHGKVRIALSEHVLAGFAPQLCDFVHDHPEVFLEFATSNRLVDLSKYEADVVIRIGRIPPEKMYTKDLGLVRFALYRRADETGPLRIFWPRAGETDMPQFLRRDHPDTVSVAAIDGVLPTREIILAGGGAGILPRFLGDGDSRLTSCSDDISENPYRLFIGCLHEQRNLHRIRLVMRYLTKQLTDALTD